MPRINKTGTYSDFLEICRPESGLIWVPCYKLFESGTIVTDESSSGVYFFLVRNRNIDTLGFNDCYGQNRVPVCTFSTLRNRDIKTLVFNDCYRQNQLRGLLFRLWEITNRKYHTSCVYVMSLAIIAYTKKIWRTLVEVSKIFFVSCTGW